MNWGKWIIVAFILFAGFIATLVTVCMRQDVSLVSREYYKEEIEYESQMDRIKNANELLQKPIIEKSGDYVTIDFNRFKDVEQRQLRLFRPSDARMDKTYELRSSFGTKQTFPIDGLKKGMYRARMQWLMKGKEYFIETVVNI